MSFLSDILLAAGAFGAAVYCLVLSRRLKAFTALDSGLGAAIAVLSAQVDELNTALKGTREAAQGMSSRLGSQTDRAETAARKLELLIASLHDLPDPSGDAASTSSPTARAAPGEATRESAASLQSPRARILRRRNLEPAA